MDAEQRNQAERQWRARIRELAQLTWLQVRRRPRGKRTRRNIITEAMTPESLRAEGAIEARMDEVLDELDRLEKDLGPEYVDRREQEVQRAFMHRQTKFVLAHVWLVAIVLLAIFALILERDTAATIFAAIAVISVMSLWILR